MKQSDVDLIRRYGMAGLAVGAATLVRMPLGSIVGDRLPFVTFFVAVVVTAHYGGLWPAVTATLLSALVASLLFIPPPGLAIQGAAGWVGLTAFVFVGFAIAYLSAQMGSARARAQARQDQLRTILASIGDAVIAADRPGRVIFLNEVAEALTGWQSDVAIGRPVADVFRLIDELTHSPVPNPATRAIREGRRDQSPHQTLLVARDGRELPIDHNAAPIITEQGVTVGCVLIFRDVSERRRAERALQRSEQELSDFFQHASLGLHCVGPDGTILRANQAELKLLGYQRDEYVGHNIRDFHVDTRGIDDLLRRLAAGEELHDWPARLRCKDGTLKHVLISSSVLWEHGQFVHTRCFTRDVTGQRLAEAALRESEEQVRRHFAELETIYASAPIGLAFLNTELRFVNINDALAQINGVPRQQTIGRTLDEVLPPSIVEFVEPLYRQVLQTGEPLHEVEVHGSTLADPDAPRDFLVNYHPVRAADGTLLGVNTSVQDITARKHAEQALRESEARFRLLADAAPVLIWVSDSSKRGVYFNNSWLTFTGRALEQELGDGWLQNIHPGDQDHVVRTCTAAFERREPFQLEFRLRRNDGQYRWVHDHGVPRFTEHGQLAGYIGSCLDVHDRKRAEENTRFLSEATSALAELIDYESTLAKVGAVAVPTFADWSVVDVLTPDGTLKRVTVNHGDPDKTELAEQLAVRYPPQRDRPHGAAQVARTGKPELLPEIPDALLEEAAWDAEHFEILRSLGLRSYLCVPMKIHGRILGVLTFVMAESGRRFDATDLRVAQELAHRAAIAVENAEIYRELQDADRRKNEFIAILAHELRNPLAPIRSGLELLKLAPDDRETIEAARTTMQRQTEQLITLVDDLLDVSRISRGKLDLKRARVRLDEVVQSCLEVSQPLIDAAGHELTVNLPREPVYLNADPNRLAQILSNLLNNAAKYTPAGGRIWLFAERQGSHILFTVKDNGIGIPAEMQDHIFDMFAQVRDSAEERYSGLGIGLTLVKSLVELHGGRIEVHSSGTNRGSAFRVCLPVIDQHEADQTAFRPECRPVGPGCRRRVLIVDDNKAPADMLGLLIQSLGHDVRTANDGRAALATAGEFVPDVVFLDLGMPGMSGYEVAERIRSEPWGGTMKLIALTGWGQEEHRRRTEAVGFDLHLVKPANPAQVGSLLVDLDRA